MGYRAMSFPGFYIEYMFLSLGTPYPEGTIHPGEAVCFEIAPWVSPRHRTAAISSGSHITPFRRAGSAAETAWRHHCQFGGIVFTCAPRQLAGMVNNTTLLGAPYQRIHPRLPRMLDLRPHQDVAAVAVMLVGVVTDIGPKSGCPHSDADPEELFSGTLESASSVPVCLCGWEGMTKASRAPNSPALNKNGAIRALNSASASFNELKISIPHQPQLYTVSGAGELYKY
ncbi:hypothetical protein C8J57DRAFT_1239202 [Mycena rebaudengoi]|nr:hypothetical protein C8J57DRAFT_1239202 [Mycena rebaudengoi]